jgi:hypothetical protein
MARPAGQVVVSDAPPMTADAPPEPPQISRVADTPTRVLVHPADVTVYRDHTGHVVAYEIAWDE